MTVAFSYQAPGVYVEEISTGGHSIEAAGTSTAAFVGVAPLGNAYLHDPKPVENFEAFKRLFVGDETKTTDLCQAVRSFFDNGGSRAFVVNIGPGGAMVTGAGKDGRKGLDTLEEYDEVAIVAAPGFTDAGSYDAVLSHCERLKDRVAVLDAPRESPEFEIPDFTALTRVATVALPTGGGGGGAGAGGDGGDKPRAPRDSGGGQKSYLARQSSYGSQFFPWFLARNALLPNEYIYTPPSGAAAGIYSRVDAERGVHKAPANEVVRGAYNLRYRVTQKEQESLNTNGVNVIRFFGARGPVLWGARTRDPGEWKYTSVRRLFCMLEESIGRGTQWVVFEPNDETLWKSIRRDVEAFLMRMWRAGMLMGATPQQAFFVKCDAETNPQENIDAGIVTTMIGVAPVKPAEFVVFRIGQSSGGTEKVEEG